MLKRNITYEDFDGNKVTEQFYFNISKSELVEMEYSYKDGFGETLQRIVKSENKGELLNIFKTLVLNAYGEKSEDGKRFIKSQELRDQFVQSLAYDALFMELATDDGAAAEFVTGVLPKDLANEMAVQTSPVPTQLPAHIPPPPTS